MRIVLSYQPGWRPTQSSPYYLLFLSLSALAVSGGLVLGAAKRFPRWAYPYPIFHGFSLYLLVGYWLHLFHGNVAVEISFLLYDAAILAVLWLPGLRSFYRQIPRDWTLLSYGLYGLVLYLLASIDFDEAPRLNVLVPMPSLLSLAAALAHLRIRSAFGRMAALLVGTFAGLFFFWIPIAEGMVSIWIGVCMGLFLLVACGDVLAAILLAPMLLTRALRSWRASR